MVVTIYEPIWGSHSISIAEYKIKYPVTYIVIAYTTKDDILRFPNLYSIPADKIYMYPRMTAKHHTVLRTIPIDDLTIERELTNQEIQKLKDRFTNRFKIRS